MNKYSVLFLIVLLLSVSSCKEHKNEFQLIIDQENKKVQAGDMLSLSVRGKQVIDSVQYFYAGRLLNTSLDAQPVQVRLTAPLGKREVKAKIYFDGGAAKADKELILHAAQKPTLYKYKIVNTYPHDSKAFTQGLEFYQDTLYEGTGNYGLSELRKVDLKTGQVLKSISLDRKYFGEGISILNGKIYQLTWKEKTGFVYDLSSFQLEKTFSYQQSEEGWGLCNDGQYLYKSDGSDKIWILDPDTLEERSYIEPVTHQASANKVNELEWVEGKIYANTWQKEGILIINPQTGAVEGVIDLRGLKEKQNNPNADVLNGIAYHAKTRKLYVTGKYWDQIFEIEVVK